MQVCIVNLLRNSDTKLLSIYDRESQADFCIAQPYGVSPQMWFVSIDD